MSRLSSLGFAAWVELAKANSIEATVIVAAPGHFFDGHIIDGHFFDGHFFDRTYFRRDIFSTGHIFD